MFALALLFFLLAVGVARAQQCMTSYYRAKSPACVDEALAMPPIPDSDPSKIIGFLAQIFRDSAQERDRVLKTAFSDYVKLIMHISLYRAGLPDEAQKFANANNLSALPERGLVSLVPLDAVKPSLFLRDNDVLIGAYMASGNTKLIQRILENYSSADNAMVADALRIGLMISKFGPDLVPKGRNANPVQAACVKYQCNEGRAKSFRVMTLAFALWSLQSLSEQDEGIKRTMSDFFEHDARLKALFTIEQTALGNYVTAITLVTAFKDDHAAPDRAQMYEAMDKSASIYENLGSANDAFAPMMNFKK
jgi:hypothetical protein